MASRRGGRISRNARAGRLSKAPRTSTTYSNKGAKVGAKAQAINFSLLCSLLRRKSQPMAGARREAPNNAFREEHDDQGGAEGRQKDAERDNQRHHECREARRLH